MKYIYSFLILCCSAFNANAQSNFIWAERMGGTGSDAGWAITTDNSGNIYTTGFFTNTVDFDPGGGSMNLSSNGLEDIFVCKMNSAGTLLWARSVGGNDGDRGFGIAVDASGNAYITGAFVGTVDFDPGPGILNLTSGSTYGDMYILKLDASGDLVWANNYGGTGGISGYSIALDGSGNVYATGSFTGTIDFDPGAGTMNMTSTGSYDIFVCKADVNGNTIWAKQMGGITGFEDNVSNAITVDGAGSAYITGAFEETTDFDPGAGTYLLDSTGFFISKLDLNGNFVWAQSIPSMNIVANALSIDNSGNLLVAGSFSYSADFDMGSGTHYLSSPASRDIFIMKMTSSGNLIWVKQMGSYSGGDNAYGVVSDNGGYVYTTGSFSDAADFDPDAGTFTLTAAGNEDIFISKLDPSGNFVCAAKVGGTDTDYAYGIDLDAVNNVYITGAFMNSADFDPGPGTDMHFSAGLEDIFITSITDCGLSVGLSTEPADQALRIYPNPAAGLVQIDGAYDLLEVYNEIGECVQTLRSGNLVDLSALPGGIYLFRVFQKEETSLTKVVKH